MSKIIINECVYNVHPVYDLYASDENGNIIHIIKKNTKQRKQNQKGVFKYFNEKTWSIWC